MTLAAGSGFRSFRSVASRGKSTFYKVLPGALRNGRCAGMLRIGCWREVPAKRGQEITPFDRLGPEWKLTLLKYCYARYGTEDVKRCYKRLEAD